MNNKIRGFIALMPVIILSLVLLLVTVGTSVKGINARFNVLDSELKARSKYIALSCTNLALIKLKEEKNYSGHETVHIKNETCEIQGVESVSANVVVYVNADQEGRRTRMKAVLNTQNNSIISLEELNY